MDSRTLGIRIRISTPNQDPDPARGKKTKKEMYFIVDLFDFQSSKALLWIRIRIWILIVMDSMTL
jgi:hypothetical protein